LHAVSGSLALLPSLIKSIKINKVKSHEFVDDDMKMTDRAYELVQSGTPFRDAYMMVKDDAEKDIKGLGTSNNQASSGSPRNLQLNILSSRLKKISKT
jgi:argininosuccinate lyase